MSTAEKPTLRMRMHDEAIFVAGDSRRARRLGRAAAVATFLAVLWVVGLGIGMLGFDRLPGVSLLEGSHARSPVAPVAEIPAAAARDTARALFSAKTADAAVKGSHIRSRTAQSTVRAQRQRTAKKAARVAATQPAAPPPSVNPAQRARGWARKGNQAPPGQARRTQPPPAPPATSKGRRVGQTTPPAPVAPPGQAKKALEPPPPPPPPPKKG